MQQEPGSLNIRRALVTGGAGFVGFGVVAALARRGVAVRVLDPGAPHPDWPAGVEHVQGDVRERRVVRDAVRGVDVVFHVAGLWDASRNGDSNMESLNVGGTRVVVESGAPVVYTSSSITCGYGSWDRPGGEDDPSEDPQAPIRGTGRMYRLTKLAAEEIVGEADGWIANPDYVVGPGDVKYTVTGPLLAAARLPVIPAPGGGKCFVGVHDVGEGHLGVFARGRPGRRYLLGAENRRYRDVLAVLARLLGRHPRVLNLPDAVPRALASLRPLRPLAGPLEQMSLERYRDSGRARSELGWSPRPVDEALEALVAWSRTHPSPRRSPLPV